MTALLICLLLVLLIILGAPIAFALLISGSLGLLIELGQIPALGILQTSPYRTSASFLLTTIPMFLLMAEFLASGRLSRDIFRAGHYWLGHLRGGLAVATTVASAGMAALSGSSPAAAATMASIAVPEMRRYGYHDRLSLATVACSGTLAVMIPPSVILILIVLGGIYSGLVTATEAGALGAAGALIIGVLFSNLRLSGTLAAAQRTARTTAMIFAIIIGASIFGYFLSATQVTTDLINGVQALGLSPTMVLLMILGIYLLLGAFLDPVSMLILTLPLTFPLMMNLGYDAIWFGIIATKMIEIGLVTPPVGINVFVTAGAVDGKLPDAFYGATLFVLVDFAIVALLIIFPEVVTFLPDLLY